MTTAEQLVRQPDGARWEVLGGRIVGLPGGPLDRRSAAARLARLFDPAARRVGAWVSTEVLVRISEEPETALRPVLAVVAGEPPYDGIVTTRPILVVDVGGSRRGLWPRGSATQVWTVDGGGVAVDRADARSRVVAHDRLLRPSGLGGLRLAAATLCELAAAVRACPLPPVRDLGEAPAGHRH